MPAASPRACSAGMRTTCPLPRSTSSTATSVTRRWSAPPATRQKTPLRRPSSWLQSGRGRSATSFGHRTPATVEGPDGRALVLPIVQQGSDRALGVLVAGLSPRLVLDDEYRSFLSLVAAQIGTAIASAEALEEARARAQALTELDRAKTLFFSNVSHEFRTPLTLILGPLADALDDQALPTATRDQLAVAHRNSLRLLKLVNTLLDFRGSKPGASKRGSSRSISAR